MNARILALLAVLVLGGCGGGNNVHEPAPLVKLENPMDVQVAWRGDTGGEVGDGLAMGLAVADGIVYTATPNGKIKAWEASSGEIIWTTQVDFAFSSGVGVSAAADYLVIGTREGQVVALRKSDGTRVWEQTTGSEVLSPPRVAADLTVVRTSDGKLFGLETGTGAILWNYARQVPPLSLRGTSAPLRVGKIVLAGFDNGKLVGLDVKTGKELWEVPVAEPSGRSDLERMVDIDADLIIRGPVLYVSAYQSRTVAVDMRNGKLFWERESSSHAGFTTDETMLYLSEANGDVIALSRRSGGALWKQDKLKNRQLTAPAEMRYYLAVGDVDGYVHILRKKDGELVARHRVGSDPIRARPVVVGKLLLVLGTSGDLHALKLNRD